MRPRLRDLGITIGDLPVGKYNAITDVPGVSVGHTTVIYDEPRISRTGVTIIHPREDAAWDNNCFAGYHSFNGNGEMTGIAWMEESGMLISSIGITNTHQVGLVRDTLVADATANGYRAGFLLPVVAETYDGWLNDIDGFHVTRDHIYQAISSAASGAVAEGNVGGGTGMICHEFKAGIGTSSRIVDIFGKHYTVGVLVQANYGWRQNLRVDGVPVGREISPEHTPRPRDFVGAGAGSIIVIIATDAPMIPTQCKRLAQRATVGLSRVGGVGHNGSGDIFMAFATGNNLKASDNPVQPVEMLLHQHINPFFDAVADATEESILNALCAAETMTGFHGRIVHALPLDELQRVMNKYRVLS
jgi:D-aminopeptidase